MAGRTLWERLAGQNKPVANEDKYHNPLKARCGNTFHIDLLDYRQNFYRLTGWDIIDRNTGVLMADYHLETSVYGTGDTKSLTLRTVPRSGKTGAGKLDYQIVALTLFYECGWNDDSRTGIMDGVNDKAGEFVINAGTADERKYWRLNGLKSLENATVTSLKDDSGDGIIQDQEITTSNIEMWGFSRTTVDEAGQEVNEYLYVQKESDTGWLRILIGQEISPEHIIV